MRQNTFRRTFVYLLMIIAIAVIVLTLIRPSAGEDTEPARPSAFAAAPHFDIPVVGWGLCLTPMAFLVGLVVLGGINWQKLLRYQEENRFTELPDLPADLPEIALPVTQLLAKRGFTRIGVSPLYVSPKVPPIPSPVYVEPDHHVIAMVYVYGSPPVAYLMLETLYADGALLHTYFPHGIGRKHPNYSMSFKESSPAEALDHHLRRVQEFGSLHGPVYLVTSLKKRASWWNTFGARHGVTPMTGYLVSSWLLPPLLPLGLMAIVVNTHLLDLTAGLWVFYGSILALVGWLVFSIYRKHIVFRPAKKQ